MLASFRLMIVAAIVVGFTAPVHGEEEFRRSIVQIFSTQRGPNPFKPWTKQAPSDISGTGVVIDGKRIITNAHVIGFATQIYVQSYQSSDKIAAKVIAAAPGIDLAILEVDSPDFFEKHPPVPLAAALPKLKSKVNVYGYPVGGQEMSVTEGIVSRIEYGSMYYGTSALRIQVDAALNHGNSGGPAITDGKIVGIVFSGIREADKIGYLIPVEEIRTFLDDIADGKYDGKPAFDGISFQTTDNPALRKWLKLPDKITGLFIDNLRGKPDDFPLKRGDLLTHIGPNAVENDGKARIDDELRVNASYFVPKLAKDGKVEVTVYRQGQSIKLQVPVVATANTLIRATPHEYPRYLIYGPMVFTPGGMSLVENLPGSYYTLLMATGNPIATRLGDVPAFKGEELVVIACPMFPHRIIKGYGNIALATVDEVNGTHVKNLAHLAEILRDCKSDYVIFRFAGERYETIVFDRKEIEAATEEVLSDNGIRNQYSDDLKDVWNKPFSPLRAKP